MKIVFGVLEVLFMFILMFVHEGEGGSPGVRILRIVSEVGIGVVAVAVVLYAHFEAKRKREAVEAALRSDECHILGVSFGRVREGEKALRRGTFIVTGFRTRDASLVRAFYDGEEEVFEEAEGLIEGHTQLKADALLTFAQKTVFLDEELYAFLKAEESFAPFLKANKVEIVDKL